MPMYPFSSFLLFFYWENRFTYQKSGPYFEAVHKYPRPLSMNRL